MVVPAAALDTPAAWDAPLDLSAAGESAWDPQVAFDPAGNAVAVWSRATNGGANPVIQAAVRPRVSGLWGPPQDLSVAAQAASDPQIGFDGAGNAVAVWMGYSGITPLIQAAIRPAATGVWSAPQDISGTGQRAEYPQLAVDSAGNAIVVWAHWDGANSIVQAAAHPAGGVWQAPENVSAVGHDSWFPQVARDQAENAVAVWQSADGTTNSIVQAAVRPASGVWQAPEDLSAAGEYAGDAHVALDAAGNAVAVWTRFDGENSNIQAALRPASGGLANTSGPVRRRPIRLLAGCDRPARKCDRRVGTVERGDRDRPGSRAPGGDRRLANTERPIRCM